MNTFYRITVAIYALISTILAGVIMMLPFGDKKLLALILDRAQINLLKSKRYDVLVFIIGLVLLFISIALLTSGIRGKRASKYISRKNDKGSINISANSIENIALAMSKRFQGVKDAKAKASFHRNELTVAIKVQAFTDINLPELSKGIQERVRESIESSTDIKVRNVTVNIDNVSQQGE